MTGDSLQLRILRYGLLDPLEDALHLWRRLQNNEAFRHYLEERRLYALPLVLGLVLATFACTGAAMVIVMPGGTLAALAGIIVIGPIVLIGSFWVQAHLLLSWFEGRSLAMLQQRRRLRQRGLIGRWLARKFRIDPGPLPQVPLIPALLFLLLPAAALANVATSVAVGLLAFQIAGVIFFARRDPVAPEVDHSAVRRPVEASQSFPAVSQREVRVPNDMRNLDFASPAARSGIKRAARRFRHFLKSGVRVLRYLVELCLVNVLPFIECSALIGGIYAVAQGHQSASERGVALGMLVIGATLVLTGLLSIVTQRMSFRFHGPAHTGYAGATAVIAGMMQLIAGGLALAAAYAVATRARQASLDYLLANPWPLLIPLGLLLIGAGVLLVRRSSTYVGPLGMAIFIVPKTLVGLAALVTGAGVLAAWGCKIYDPATFQDLVRLVPHEAMKLLANGWTAAIALLR